MNISVIIPVYNTPADHLKEAYTSIRDQTYQSNDIILVDDGSTNPETRNMLFSFRDPGTKLLFLDKNYGTATALNKGHQLALNDWIAVMGSDDISFSERFEKQVEYITKNPDTHVLGTGLFAFRDSDSSRTKTWSKKHKEIITDLSGSKWITNHGTSMYHKSVLEQTKGYNPSFGRGQDVDFFCRVFSAGFNIRNIPDILYAYRRYS